MTTLTWAKFLNQPRQNSISNRLSRFEPNSRKEVMEARTLRDTKQMAAGLKSTFELVSSTWKRDHALHISQMGHHLGYYRFPPLSSPQAFISTKRPSKMPSILPTPNSVRQMLYINHHAKHLRYRCRTKSFSISPISQTLIWAFDRSLSAGLYLFPNQFSSLPQPAQAFSA